MYNTLLIIITTTILTACNTVNIKPGETLLQPNEGIIITNLHTNIDNGNILIHHKDSSFPSATFEPIKAPSDFRVIKLNEGEARFSRIYMGNLESWRHNGAYFNIEAGKINYIGDFVVEWTTNGGGIGVISQHIDREKETIEMAKSKYPELFSSYPYVKKIPIVKLNTVKDYKPIKEIEEVKNQKNISNK